MSIFSSKRERRLWFWVLIVVVSIYATLGLAGRLTASLRDRNLLDTSFFVGFVLIVVVIISSGLRKQSNWQAVWSALGILVVYGMVMTRMFVSPEERTHLVEYGIVALLIYQALTERDRNGRKVPVLAILAIIVTAVIGFIDEGIQALLPSRVYDIRDVGFNALAGFMAVLSMVVLTWVRQRTRKEAELKPEIVLFQATAHRGLEFA